MFSKNIKFKIFQFKIKKKDLKEELKFILKNNTELIKSLGKNYKNNYDLKKIKKLTKNTDLRLVGIGGSILGAQAIDSFLQNKIKNRFTFIDNLITKKKIKSKKKVTNLIISKSGNTLETIINSNILITKKDKNIFITEKKNSYLRELAQKLKAEILNHNNFIGGRYSVLSEVGMLPAELMGLNVNKFRQLNNLIKDKFFLNSLMSNVSAIIDLHEKKIYNSVIINYDPKSDYLFKWYQQLVAESLGKKSKGILPIISNMPKDNHSVMQLYLDGFKKNFFTFFFVKEKKSIYLNKKILLSSHKFYSDIKINDILYNQKIATENIFFKKKIPYRSFELDDRNEDILGKLFIFFILETILVGRALNINPFDQPSVELIKNESKRLFIQK